MSDERQIRIAENESRFRAINDRLERELRSIADAGEALDFVCECGHLSCRESIPVPAGDYETVRANPRAFFLVPGHEIPDVEQIIERRGDYLVVEKIGEGARYAEDHDPRQEA